MVSCFSLVNLDFRTLFINLILYIYFFVKVKITKIEIPVDIYSIMISCCNLVN